jgi:flavorubredoxin
MLRNVAGDLFQLGECAVGAVGHEAVRVYVLMNDAHPIIVDCGSQLHRASILKDLDELLAGRAPECVLLTHSELPHAGNLLQVARRWPAVKVIVSNVMLPYIEIAPGLPAAQVTTATPGSTVEIAGRRIEFVEALLKDQPGSQWIFDAQTGALFTGDGFGYTHAPGECEAFADESGGIQVEKFRRHHRAAFRFLRWVVAERFNADLHRLFARYSVQIIAPIHGNAIRSDISAHVERLKHAISQICTERAPA